MVYIYTHTKIFSILVINTFKLIPISLISKLVTKLINELIFEIGRMWNECERIHEMKDPFTQMIIESFWKNLHFSGNFA